MVRKGKYFVAWGWAPVEASMHFLLEDPDFQILISLAPEKNIIFIEYRAQQIY